MKNNNLNLSSIVFIVLLVVALVAGVFLVNQKQETRRGAYFAGAKMTLLPAETTALVGDNVPVQLWVETDTNAKVSAVDTKICYGTELKLDATDITTLVDLNTSAFRVIEYAKVTSNCLRLVVVSSGITPENLKSGLVKVAAIRFKAVAAGAGNFKMDIADVKVTGYNPDPGATDTSMKLSTVTGAKYVIGGTNGGTCGWCGTSCIKKTSDTVCTQQAPPAGKSCITNSAGVCEIVDVSSSSLLKFRMSFYGIRPDAACADADKMPLTVTVRAADGTSKVYTNVIAVKESNSGDLGFYDVKVPLVDFAYKNNLSVFVKGPKSLQVKYGINNQDKYYDKAGGELMGLTNVEATAPMFSFEKYPLLAGDVTGPNNVQDGVVDGLDFSYVKGESIKRTEVASHGYMLADLNGNCKMESQDLSNLMLSLSVKQGQLY